MQDLNDMLYFAEVVERGGFAAAGRVLGVPKSRLSRRVSDLEAHLGVRLLHRTTRKLSLTDVGEAYLRHCQAMRDSAQAAADVVAQVQTEPRGTVRLTCPVTLAHSVLGKLMPQFLQIHPLVRVEMQVTNRVVNLVEEGVDIALRVRATVDDSGSMVVKRLDESTQVLVASPAQLARQGVPKNLADLPALDSMAMSAADGRTSLKLISPDGREETVHHTPRYVADDLVSLKFAALAGVGICWLPNYLCHAELADGRLVQVLPDWSTPRSVVYAVFPSRRGLSPAVRHMLDFLGDAVPGGAAIPQNGQAEAMAAG
ncbi:MULTISPECIES: LysR family transcriptional regulator [unclassified Acidovorax]|uniref:LysR family transcriptional regulator n=1 Tax=unclassified Acidovorax TaxID=2684926 RepID=UPI0028830E1D|nr:MULTISPECIES: LysR family transcriptional regulator [unclassified Acidovorax]